MFEKTPQTEHTSIKATHLDLKILDKHGSIASYSLIDWLNHTLIDTKQSDCNWTRTQNHLVHKRPVWPNGGVFVCKLSGSGFESSCGHLNFRFHSCFEQGVCWHSGDSRVLILSETRTWHDKNIQTENTLFPMLNLCEGKQVHGGRKVTANEYFL